MNKLKKFALVVYATAFTTKAVFALDVVESVHKTKVVVLAELVFWIALILDSIYNTK